MATIKPIKGLRYTPGAGPMVDLVTPPYDVIDATAQEQYYKRHPHNIIRLEYGKVYPSDDENNNRYSRAAKDFSQWQSEGVLAPEGQPALYLYEQEFQVNGKSMVRSGLICGVKLEPYENGVVLPHEETLPKHKADRLALMMACRANFSPIFALYADPDLKIDGLLRTSIDKPDVEFKDENGQLHRLWVVSSAEITEQVQAAMASMRIFIADGHHRYETALNYRNERRGHEGNSQEDKAYDYVMMTLVNLYDPGLVVLPTHRLVKNVTDFQLEVLLEQVTEHFEVETLSIAGDRSNFNQCIDFLKEKSHTNENNESGEIPIHNNTFALYAGGNNFYILTLKNNVNLPALMPEGKSEAWRQLDVSVLHSLILEKYLGIGGEQRANESNLTYTREEKDALDKVDSGEYQMVFFMNPTLVEEVTAVATNGEKMPQKSTFFYPKLITGLLINKLD